MNSPPPSSLRLPQLVPGYRFDGRYELLYAYAQGGMAIVWVARVKGKHGFEKLVAVKTIRSSLARDEGFRKMFLDEARIASRIRHPNVVEIDDLGEEAGTLYMVMEWVEGDSWGRLYDALLKRGGPIPANLVLRIAADACAGLHAAHELRGPNGALLNVVHRDISPQNILISTEGITKVIDFGIARAADRMTETTTMGLMKGKVDYTSPEQARTEPCDRRVDIWAMGTILYQFFSGSLPYHGKDDLDTLRKLAAGKPPRPLPKELPGSIEALIMRALQGAPEARFQTAADMRRALEAAMTDPVDVAAFMRTCLSANVETRRRNLDEALAEAVAREPGAPRSPLASIPDLGEVPSARPPAASVRPAAPVDDDQAATLVIGAPELNEAERRAAAEIMDPSVFPSAAPAKPSPSPSLVKPYLIVGAVLTVLGLLFLVYYKLHRGW